MKKASKQAEGVALLAALESATEEDLAEIDQMIAAGEQKLRELTEQHERTLESLRAARKVVDIRLHGKPQRKPRKPREVKQHAEGAAAAATPEEPAGDSLACKIHDLLSVDGSLSVEEIAAHFACKKAVVAMCVSPSPWFRREGDVVHIA